MSPGRQTTVREGSLAAQRELVRLGVDESRRVEVFDVIEREGIWLMFQPLDNLYGVYERIGDAAGIALHSGHPLGLQRFTAAHEYGHHVLKHEGSLDTQKEIEGNPANQPREIAAQAFAATFLMPVQLINAALKRLGLSLDPHEILSEQLYELSLEVGSSYMAAATQLAALGKITWDEAKALTKLTPISIKEKLGGGERPRNARADVWSLDESDDERQLAVRLDDEIDVQLPETPTSGYRWVARIVDSTVHVLHDDDGSSLVIVSDGLVPRADDVQPRFGGQRRRHLRLLAAEPGEATVELALVRPWLERESPLKTVTAHVQVTPPRTGDLSHGVSLMQQQVLFRS